MEFTPDTLYNTLQALSPARRYLIAYSGGVDSHVLLHAMARLRERLDAELLAVHIDHQLQAASPDWAEHCARQAAAEGIPYRAIKVTVEARGESPEAAARKARYRALRDLMGEGDALLTAHHLDDQAETLLIQLMRGAGPRGLAAMAAQTRFGPGRLLRPMLDISRGHLEAYARTQGIAWVEDPSNSDRRYDRNFLRHEILPSLRQRWPSLGQTLGRAARHQAEAVEMMDELAQRDLCMQLRDTLPVNSLLGLSESRQKNLLRYWIHGNGYPLPGERRLDSVLADLMPAAADANPVVCWDGVQLRRYRDSLYLQAPLPDHDPGLRLSWDGSALDIPSAPGRLSGTPGLAQGLRADCLRAPVELRFRQGGESCHPLGRGMSRDVKKLMQEAGVPPWLRARLPLIYIDGQLAAIPGICVSEAFAATAGVEGIQAQWEWRKAGSDD